MGMLEITYCTGAEGDGQDAANSTNITLIGCLEGRSIMALGGAFAEGIARYIIFAFMILTALVTVLLNAVVITCVAKSRVLKRTNYSVYAVSLAISDLIVGAIGLPALIVYTVYGYWPLGSATCTAYIVLDVISTSNSNMHLDVVAFDRFRAVADPMKYRSTFTKSRARKLALVPWAINILFYFPGIIVVRVLDEIQGINIPNHCYYPRNVIFYVGAIGIGSYATPIGLIILNICSVVSLRRRNRNTNGRTQDMMATDQTLASVAEREKIRVQNRRCLLTLFAQVIMFLICWIPWMILEPFLLICEECVPATFLDISYWMVYANSTLNPLAYFMFNKDYRTAFSTIFECLKRVNFRHNIIFENMCTG